MTEQFEFTVEYDGEDGFVLEKMQGLITDAINVRKQLQGTVFQHAVVAELGLLGYIVTPPAVIPENSETWYITFGFGGPFGGRYTEITGVPADITFGRKLDLVRQTANASYGTAWAFPYAPDRFYESIEKYGMTIRERIPCVQPDEWEED